MLKVWMVLSVVPKLAVTEAPVASDCQSAVGTEHPVSLIRFSINSIAESFAAGEQDVDRGLRATISLKNTERPVGACQVGGTVGVLNLTTSPASKISAPALSVKVLAMLR